MLANDLNLSIHNPILIYAFLALYGLFMVAIVLYVNSKFRGAARTLKALQAEWSKAESSHAGFVGAAQEHLAKLSTPAPVQAPATARTSAVGFDVRNHVVTMAKRGIGIADIARNCGLHEGEVEVLLGMSRLVSRN